MDFTISKEENAKNGDLKSSEAMRRPTKQSRQIELSSVGTLKVDPEGSEALNAASVRAIEYKPTMLRIRGGGKTNDDIVEEKDEPDNMDTMKLSKNQKRKLRKKKANKLEVEKKLEQERKDRRMTFEIEKTALIQSEIKYLQTQIEISDANLLRLQDKLMHISSTRSRVKNNLMNDICNIYDEKEYYQKKIKKCQVILTLLDNIDRDKRLPRNFVKMKKISGGKRETRSSTKDKNSKTQAEAEDDHIIIEISSSDESNDDIDDEDFDIKEHIEQRQVPRIEKPKSTMGVASNSKKKYKSKNQQFLKKKYKTYDINVDSEEEEMFELSKNPTVFIPVINHQWVYDLRKDDITDEPFSNNFLVILRGTSSKLAKLDLHDIQHLSKHIFKTNIKEVQFIQRGSSTQLYVIKHLQKSLHFTLGSKSTLVLIEYCKANKISYQKYTNHYQVENPSFTLRNELNHQQSIDSIESQYTQRMIELSKIILPILLSTKTAKTSRAEYVLNLGITDQKVHQHKRISITGKSGLQLISTSKKSTKITEEAMSEIGKFLMYIIKNVIPTTCSPNIFEPSHPCEKEYLELFAKQLNLYDKDDLRDFNIPSISILINSRLNPHCDSKNPISLDHDTTFSITVQVPIQSFSLLLQQTIPNEFTATIPFCIVMYKRQCLMHLANYERKIQNYIATDDQYSEARKKIIQILSDGYYTDLDYGGLFFTQHRNRLVNKRFKYQDNRIFKDKMAFINEAVDKCGYWSSLLHVFYLYAHLHGVKRDDVLSFVLFFAHQCNTTVIIVKAMITLTSQSENTKNEFLYSTLANICNEYKVNKNNKDIGCGGGGVERFSPSNNELYSHDELRDNCEFLNKICGEATNDLKSPDKMTPEICYENYWKLEKKILKLKGIGKVRASHLIQLASLLGIIPLHYYAFLPTHLAGGTGKFLINELGFGDISSKDTNTLMKRHSQELEKLQDIYGSSLTSNMFENMCCILGRDQRKEIYDIFYYLPWATNSCVTNETTIQLTFRIKVHSMKHIELTCKSDDKESIVYSTIPSEYPDVVSYNKHISKNEDFLVLAKDGHYINNEWINSQYQRTFNSISANPTFDDITLPTFETWYTKVCELFLINVFANHAVTDLNFISLT